MTLSQFNGIWLPLDRGMLIHSIHESECRVISTKSRCPCVIEFEVSYRRPFHNTLTKHQKNVVHISPMSSKPSFFQWLWSFPLSLRNPHFSGSLDNESFPQQNIEPIKNDDSIIVVTSDRLFPKETNNSFYKVIIKTRDTIRQEEMASHLINEVILYVT